jgi:flagellar motor switch protein FliN/FliY
MSTTTGVENTASSGGTAPGVIPGADSPLADAVSAKTADFAELDASPATGSAAALDNLLDVTVSVTAELGRATTSIGQLLKLNVGSVVELERLVSDPVDLMAQGIRLARGEVVVVEDRFAIRIREIIDPKKRT